MHGQRPLLLSLTRDLLQAAERDPRLGPWPTRTADPTLALLLGLARPGPAPEATARLARTAAGVDWARLVRLARACGLAGLVTRSLEQLGWGAAPAAAREQLVVLRLLTEAANRAALAHCRRLCEAGRGQGLVLVPLKGAALLLLGVYPGLGLRDQADLDLLTTRAQLPAAHGLLLDQGYAPVASPRQSARHEQNVAYVLRREGAPPLWLDLHWTPFQTLFSRPPLDRAAWDRLQAHPCGGGADLWLLAPEDQLLSLTTHLAHHRYRGSLKWAVDLLALVEHLGPTLDWETVRRRALQLGALRSTRHCLRLVQELLGVRLLPPAWLPGGAGASLLRLATPPEALVASVALPPLWWRTLVDLLSQDRLRAGARYLSLKAGEVRERRGARVPRWLVRHAEGDAPQ